MRSSLAAAAALVSPVPLDAAAVRASLAAADRVVPSVSDDDAGRMPVAFRAVRHAASADLMPSVPDDDAGRLPVALHAVPDADPADLVPPVPDGRSHLPAVHVPHAGADDLVPPVHHAAAGSLSDDDSDLRRERLRLHDADDPHDAAVRHDPARRNQSGSGPRRSAHRDVQPVRRRLISSRPPRPAASAAGFFCVRGAWLCCLGLNRVTVRRARGCRESLRRGESDAIRYASCRAIFGRSRLPEHAALSNRSCGRVPEPASAGLVSALPNPRSGPVLHATAAGLSDDQRLYLPAQSLRVAGAERDVSSLPADPLRKDVPPDARAEVLPVGRFRVPAYAQPARLSERAAGDLPDRRKSADLQAGEPRRAVPAARGSGDGSVLARPADRRVQSLRRLSERPFWGAGFRDS